MFFFADTCGLDSYSEHAVLSSDMFYLNSVEFIASTSHVLSCLHLPLFLLSSTQIYTDCPQDKTSHAMSCPYPYLTFVSVQLAIKDTHDMSAVSDVQVKNKSFIMEATC